MKNEQNHVKQPYEPASIEIIRFAAGDILTTSDLGNEDPGIGLPLDPFLPTPTMP